MAGFTANAHDQPHLIADQFENIGLLKETVSALKQPNPRFIKAGLGTIK
jgi:hypothetical protein